MRKVFPRHSRRFGHHGRDARSPPDGDADRKRRIATWPQSLYTNAFRPFIPLRRTTGPPREHASLAPKTDARARDPKRRKGKGRKGFPTSPHSPVVTRRHGPGPSHAPRGVFAGRGPPRASLPEATRIRSVDSPREPGARGVTGRIRDPGLLGTAAQTAASPSGSPRPD